MSQSLAEVAGQEAQVGFDLILDDLILDGEGTVTAPVLLDEHREKIRRFWSRYEDQTELPIAQAAAIDVCRLLAEIDRLRSNQ